MKKIISAALLLIATVLSARAADTENNYRRSSIYSILLQHSGQNYLDDIRNAYVQQPLSDKFNDHSLSVVSLETGCGVGKFEEERVIRNFLEANNVPQRLVAKWFSRNKADGTFDISMLMDRGYYDASQGDLQLSSMLQRGSAIMADAGEELIGNTFIIVYDVIYVDKEEKAQKTKKVLNGISEGIKFASYFIPGGSMVSSVADLTKTAVDLASDIANTIAGFSVKVNAHLYQLEWNEEVAATFYSEYYVERGHPDAQKAALWPQAASLFKLKYIGSDSSVSAKTVGRGLYSSQDVIRKVTCRALNKSVADLQRSNEVFRVKVPISNISEGRVYASIGLKEGIQETDVFEVLEAVVDQNGRTTYKKRGTVQPVKIWDNRYMAVEEGAENADINYTEFVITSGTDFYPGMLLRQGNGKGSSMKTSASSSSSAVSAAAFGAAGFAGAAATKSAKTKASSKPKSEKKLSAQTEQQQQQGGKTKADDGKKRWANSFFIMANFGYDTAATDVSKGKLQFGGTFAWAQHFGTYVKYRSSFCNEKTSSDVITSGIWTDGTGSGRIRYNSLTFGALFGVSPKVYFYAGLGYGIRQLGWYSYKGSDGSGGNLCGIATSEGLAIDGGMMFRFGHFSLMGGVSSLMGSVGEGKNCLFPEIGLGVAF